jgi:uncharacterized OsmC-like protein
MTMSAMTTTTAPAKPRREPRPLNGVDTPTLFATINAVAGQRELAKFQFRASNRWVAGTNSRTRIEQFHGAGGEHEHTRVFEYDADHPLVLTGTDKGPAPVEFLLVGLTACLTAGIGNIAAARGVELTEVESIIEGDIDLSGILGLPGAGRNGYDALRVHFRIAGKAPAETLRKIVEQSRDRSAVYDVLTRGVPVAITVEAD